MNAITDHTARPAKGRIAALAGLAIAGGLAWFQPGVEFDVLALFVLGPGGLVLWQKLQSPRENSA